MPDICRKSRDGPRRIVCRPAAYHDSLSDGFRKCTDSNGNSYATRIKLHGRMVCLRFHRNLAPFQICNHAFLTSGGSRCSGAVGYRNRRLVASCLNMFGHNAISSGHPEFSSRPSPTRLQRVGDSASDGRRKSALPGNCPRAAASASTCCTQTGSLPP
jgi:hypothetical protein